MKRGLLPSNEPQPTKKGRIPKKPNLYFNCQQLRWETLSPPEYEPSLAGRFGQTATVVGKEAYLIGGSFRDSGAESTLDIWVINLENWSFARFSDPNGPPYRWAHTVTLVDNRYLYGFGGFNSKFNMNDLWIFDTEKKKYLTEKSESAHGTAPKFRGFHSSALYKNELFIFGGAACVGGPYRHYNDLYSLNCSTMCWKNVKYSGEISGRSQHSVAVIGNNMIVIGGYDSYQVFSDVFVFDLENYVWKKIEIESCLGLQNQRLVPQDFKINSSYRPCFTLGSRIILIETLMDPTRLCCLDTYRWEWSWIELSITKKGVFFKTLDSELVCLSRWDRQIFRCCITDALSTQGNSGNQLASDMLNMFHYGSFKDFALKVEDKTISCHKCILYARCGYFRAMFESGMLEANASEIQIADASYNNFKILLDYLYTGIAQVNSQTAVEVLVLSDKYLLPDLRSACEWHLIKTLNLQNVWEFLRLTDVHEAPLLLEACMDLVVGNWSAIVNTEEYLKLEENIKIKIEQAVREHDATIRQSLKIE